MTSAIIAAPVVVRRDGDPWPTAGRTCRTGVKPLRTFCSARRIRGVVAPSPCGTLSAVNICGGTLSQSSKSSGALRFFPIEVDDPELDMEKPSCNGGGAWECIGNDGICLSSGVRALKTGGGILSSGLSCLDAAELVRVRELDATAEKSGIAGSVGIDRLGAGGCDTCGCEGPGFDEVDAVGKGKPFGVESELLAAVSLSWRVLTFRVRNSTFDVSFFSSLRNLAMIFSTIRAGSDNKTDVLDESIIIFFNLLTLGLQEFFHLHVPFLKVCDRILELGQILKSGEFFAERFDRLVMLGNLKIELDLCGLGCFLPLHLSSAGIFELFLQSSRFRFAI